MGKNKYRLMGGLLLFAILYILVLFVKESDMQQVVAGILQKSIIQTSLPAYSFISQVDSNVKFNLADSILNDIYPMNEYLMANEGGVDFLQHANTKESPSGVSDAIFENGTDSSGGTATQDENTTVSAEANQAGTTGADATQTTAAVQPTTSTTGSDMSVVSRNVVTGNVYARENLNDYNFVKSFYTVPSTTALTTSILRPKEFLDKNMTMSHDASTPQILIFHTHSQEAFADSVEGDPSTSIVGVGDYLTKILTDKYGYNVIHDTSVYDLVDGKLDRAKAYTYSENGIAQILKQNPSIEVVIDLHRDGVSETTHLVTNVDGKQMSKIMFFNGLSYSNVNGDIGYLYNPYRDDNLAMSLQMQLIGDAYYPGFLRNIYVNAYRYCLHERAKSMLIEAGAQTNTVQEEKNAMEPLADILDKLLRGEKTY